MLPWQKVSDVLVGLFIVLAGLFIVLVGLFIVLVGLFIVLAGLFVGPCYPGRKSQKSAVV